MSIVCDFHLHSGFSEDSSLPPHGRNGEGGCGKRAEDTLFYRTL